MKEQITDPIQFTYETRCRRCGSLKEWFFARQGDIEWVTFATAMTDFITHPRLYFCGDCKKETVQDVVSYTTCPKNKV
jgi:DNA-directed RNA polymerase subunit RPC12/RpoP